MASIFLIDPDQTASPTVSIIIQPYEQDNSIKLTPSNFPGLEVDVQKVLGQPSTAFIVLPPNSPDPNNIIGLNAAPSNVGTNSNNLLGNLQDLTSLITPMSTVTIQMTRGSYTYIVFFGVVISTKETESRQNERVLRLMEISCIDMQYYLTNFAYFTLSWMGAEFNILKNIGNYAGAKMLASGGVSNTSPQVLASNFMNLVANAFLANMQLPVNDGRYNYPQLVESRFGPFNSGSIAISFPFISSFYNAEGTWWNKFTTFFPTPYYEMFFQTFDETVDDTIPNETSTGIPLLLPPTIPANTFTLDGRPFKNMFIARQMPFPRISSDTGNPPFILDLSSWNALGEYQFANSNTPFIQSSMEFSQEDARSFYIVDPSLINQLYGGSTGGGVPAYVLYNFAAAVDPLNLTKFGYRPEISQIQWFFSPVPNSTTSLVSFGASLLLTLSSYFEPLPLCAKGTITLPLSPTILQGNKITLQPFKNGAEWTFYIDSVTHHYEFGEASVTTLQLSRGLPQEIYFNKDNLLTSMLQGLVERTNYQYSLIANPAVLGITGLTLIASANGNAVMNKLLPAWGVPQAQATSN